MKISVKSEDVLAFTIDTKAVTQDSFKDLFNQLGTALLSKWWAENPQKDHQIKIIEIV